MRYDVPPGIHWQQPTIKKRRKRADARQLEVLNRMYALTAYPSTEERWQLARELDMSARRVEIWLAHAFVYITCIIYQVFFPGSRTKGRRTVQQDEILPTLRSARPL